MSRLVSLTISVCCSQYGSQLLFLVIISLAGESWPLISDQAKDLVASLLQKNKKFRIDAESAWSHPWIVLLSLSNHLAVFYSLYFLAIRSQETA